MPANGCSRDAECGGDLRGAAAPDPAHPARRRYTRLIEQCGPTTVRRTGIHLLGAAFVRCEHTFGPIVRARRRSVGPGSAVLVPATNIRIRLRDQLTRLMVVPPMAARAFGANPPAAAEPDRPRVTRR
ncbi:hypothetical protein [Nocardia sp. NPDC060249]|uniref:hypothetical protein n=1 Tax=Nocardia sp. NPDC060249 TaxID=3347082 RepID=UPI003668DDCA